LREEPRFLINVFFICTDSVNSCIKKDLMKILRKYKLHFRLIILLAAACGLYLFRDTASEINRTTERLYYSLSAGTNPDTNIVIIHISQNDIQSLNGWPLKRSYYALLINKLKALKCRKIGLEVFLSEKVTSQSLYNDLLINEIKQADNVVLSSVLSSYIARSQSAELLLPSPKSKLPALVTGHINYYEKEGIHIPLMFLSAQNNEPAFSLSLLDPESITTKLPSIMKVNFFSSWQSFRHYSLLEIYDLMETGSAELNNFKGKIVLVGVSSPQIAQIAFTPFDDNIPGVAIHAFAIDNIVHNRYIRNNYLSFSAFIIILLITALILFGLKSNVLLKYFIAFSVFAIIGLILFRVFYIELQYSLFILPIICLFIFDGLLQIYEQNLYYRNAVNETELLRLTLSKKESQLGQLQKELDISGENSDHQLIEKISSLKHDIETLKLQQFDQQAAAQEQVNGIQNFLGIVYNSKIMSNIVDLIKRAAPENATVLITGESGTGKELVAKAIHQLSKRNDKKFVAVNCAALSDTLLESELFGHVKGAFTNAIANKTGRFEAAHKGTIFLDEIGETTENFQVKLLRILQSGEYEKVGSSETSKVDVRVVAATNKSPENLIREKKFREDLYYRLNIIRIELPPLRERMEDIEALTRYFLSKEKENINISAAALIQLKNSSWKGNVRELESVIKRAAIFARSSGRQIIKISDLPEVLTEIDKFSLESLILESLREKKFSHSSINETAEELGNLNRTIVSENFRGIVFSTFCDMNFDLEKTIKKIADSDDPKAVEKVKSKVNTFLNNVEKDVRQVNSRDFDLVRLNLISKYKNLPQKFHKYLDDVIRFYISK